MFSLPRFLTRYIALMMVLFVGSVTKADESDGLAAQAKEVFRSHCYECHGPDSATAGIEIFDHADLMESRHVVAGEPDESLVYQVITSTAEDSMPPPDRIPMTAEEITLIRKWIVDDAKPFPNDVIAKPDSKKDTSEVEKAASDENAGKDKTSASEIAAETEVSKPLASESVPRSILRYVRNQPDADRPFLRFFSIRHLLDGGITTERIRWHRLALAKAINHLSRERNLVTPAVVDSIGGGTVFAIDLRTLGWHRKALVATDKDGNPQELNFFDLALLEYPYGMTPESSAVGGQLKREFLDVADQARPVAFVHADWFCSVALSPPLYNDFLQLPRTLAELEKRLEVDVAANLDDGLAIRAGMIVSGVSRNNRAVERHPQRDGYYWKSHDFLTSLGHESILRDPIDFRPSGGEMIFRLPNGMQGYYVCDARGDRLDAAPTSIVVDKFASDRIVRNGLGCIRCHGRGIKDFRDVVHDIVDKLPSRPGFDKEKTLSMYPGKSTWDTAVKKDQAAFADANKTMGIDVSGIEPLSPVTSQYLDATVSLESAAARLGVESDDLAATCRSPQFTRMGLSPFVAGSVIRRDAFEKNFDAIVRAMGLGIPVVPVDGNQMHSYREDKESGVKVSTNKANQFFEPGDELRIEVENQSSSNQHIELFGRSIEGEFVSLTQGVKKLSPGELFPFPAVDQDAIEVQGGLGQEQIVLYASPDAFEPGLIYRGDAVDDRVVHRFYETKAGSPVDAAASLTKQTLVIETR